jgi:hypothetical protein
MRNRITTTFGAALLGTALVTAGLVACSVEVDEDAPLTGQEQALGESPWLADAAPPTISLHPLSCRCLADGYRCSGRLSGTFHGFEPTLEFAGETVPRGLHDEYTFVVDRSGELVATIGHEGFGAISSVYIAQRSCLGQAGGGTSNE